MRSESLKRAQDNYDKKCKLIVFRFRVDTDSKYIEFLEKQENRTDFLRRAIDKELGGVE